MRRVLLTLSCSVLVLGGLAAGPAAAAPEPAAKTAKVQGPPPASRFQKVTLNDRPGEPMASPSCPDLRVLHTARTGEVRIHDPPTGLQHPRRRRARLPARRGGPAGHRDRPGLRPQPLGLPLLLAAADTPVDDPATPTVNEGDAPTDGHRGRLRPLQGRSAAVPLQAGRQHARAGHRAEDHRGRRSTAASAATSAARSTSTGTGNLYLSTGDDTNPFFSDGYAPIDERADRNPAFDAQRSAGNTNDLRGKLLRITVGSRRRLHRPAGQPVPARHAEDPPEIYAMGLRNPFRFAVDQTNGVVYLADYSPDAQAANPQRGPAGQGRWMAIDKSGQLRLALLRDPRPARTSTTTSPPVPPARRSTAPARSTTRRYNTGRRSLPPVAQPRSSTRTACRLSSRSWARGGIGPDGRPGVRLRPTQRLPRQVAAVLRRHAAVLRVDPRLHQGVPPRPPNGRSRWIDSGTCRPSSSTTRWTWSSARTARSTSWSTATATSPRTRRRSWPGSTTCGATARRCRRSQPTSTAGLAPLTVQFSSAGTVDPDGDPIAYAWDFNADGGRDSTDPNPSYTFTENGVYRRDAEGHRQHRPVGGRLGGDHRGERGTGGRADHLAGARRAVRLRRGRDLPGDGHRRHGRRLLEGLGGLHPRPRRSTGIRCRRPPGAPGRSRPSWTPATPEPATSGLSSWRRTRTPRPTRACLRCPGVTKWS